MTKLSEKFNFTHVEKKWQEYWQEYKIYQWQASDDKENSYIIDTPPPTVSGELHIGHVFSYNHTDFIARYMRMKGKNVFYPIGFDDNGLPTERLVEKQKSIKAKDLPRDEFIRICHEVVAIEEQKFKDLFISLGLSVDWSCQYQTISDRSRQISQMSFLDLINKNQIYRSFEPVLWDPVDHTAISQAEIEDKEKDSTMYDINFSLSSGELIAIATTRPELLAACVAVFCHPLDERYKKYVGLNAHTPLFKVAVPIIADDKVDMEKGTGLVMCCTFGDTMDVAWWRAHKLPTRMLLNKEGKVVKIDLSKISAHPDEAQNILTAIEGLSANQSRAKIVEILKERELIVAAKPIKHSVKCAERSGAPLEIIVTPQWFLKTIEHKESLLERSNELNWHPSTMKIKLDTWINGVSWDWCISRQRYFGVPFPVWYSKRPGEEGKAIFASPKQLPADPLFDLPEGYNRSEVVADSDVMDTWATSCVSPQLNAYGINDTMTLEHERYNRLFPADLRPQAHEILRTWAFGTILKSHLHDNKLPWKNIMISGWCLAPDKSKMSKSKGNIVKPESLLVEYGSDVIRYWASNARLGSDTTFSQDVINNGKRLVNKIWNAAKFVELHIKPSQEDDFSKVICASDKAILALITKVIEELGSHFEAYEYSLARETIEKFFWQDFCNNYLEVSKSRIYNQSNSNPNLQESGLITLSYVFKTILKLFAPFLPYITEELYKAMYNNQQSIHERFSWPKILPSLICLTSLQEYEISIEILEAVRKLKSSKNLSMKATLNKIEIITSQKIAPDLLEDLKNVTNTMEISFVENFKSPEEIYTLDKLKINLILS
jgi:valyl-tRNA synthetase